MKRAVLQARSLYWKCRLCQTSHDGARSAGEKYNVFVNPTKHVPIVETAGAPKPTGSLSNIGEIALKDNIATSAAPTTAASHTLRNYTSPYNATVVEQLVLNGGSLDGKTNMDEFGMGSHSQTSNPAVKSPAKRGDEELSPGGSSGGSAVAVALGLCNAALSTDTGGSVRLPAAYTGTVGFKPSYGLLSRWGVIAYANSLDTVGVISKDVRYARKLFETLNVFDPKDPTAQTVLVRQRIDGMQLLHMKREKTPLRIGVPTEYNITEISLEVRQAWAKTLSRLQDEGHSIHPVSLPTTRQALSAYYVLAPAEASSNLAKYDGVRYGTRTAGSDASPLENLPLYARTRGEGFGDEVKRRILLGAYTLSSEAIDNYFIQAQKVRRLVQRDFDRVFRTSNLLLDETWPLKQDDQKVDLLLTPTAPTLPPSIEDVKKQTPVERYMNDVFTVPANLAGLPAISVPVRLSDVDSEPDDNGIPTRVTSVGMQVLGQFGDDRLVLDAAEIIEKLQRSANHSP